MQMVKYPTLKKAPIVEALVDIQTNFPHEVGRGTLDSVYEKLSDRFPTREQHGLFEFGFPTTPQGVPQPLNATSSFVGLRLSSADKKSIIQIGERGFTYGKLAPYTNGDDFRDEARDLWNVFVEVTKPASVHRLALRCLNRIELPLPIDDFDDYFQTFVRLAPGMPQGLAELLMHFSFPQPDNHNGMAQVTLQLEPIQANPSHVGILFDIDVAEIVNLEPKSSQLWETLAAIRGFRNQIFFESLTPKALRMYQ